MSYYFEVQCSEDQLARTIDAEVMIRGLAGDKREQNLSIELAFRDSN
jgi:hypothetical protein